MKQRLWPYIAVIVLLGALAYSNTLHSPFVFDDEINIVNNPGIRELSNIPGMFAGTKGSWASRPLMNATFALNYAISGYDTWSYHATNLLLHLLNTVLLFMLIIMTGRHAGYDEEKVRLAAVLTAALFALHPAQTEGVTYIMSRSILLSACAYFAGLILFLKAATSEGRRGLYIAALFAVSLMGVASRENFMVFPAVLVLYDLAFIARFKVREAVSRYAIYLPVLLCLIYMGYLSAMNTYDVASDFPGWGIPPAEYALTQFKVQWSYMRMLALPVGLTIDHDYALAKGLAEPAVLLAAAGYAALWALALLQIGRRPAGAFGVLWFLITLLPVSFALAASGALMNTRLGDVMAEHRLYLPSAGIFLSLSAAVASLAAGSKKNMSSAAAVIGVLCLVLAGTTYDRNSVWKNARTLWEDAARKSPGSFRAHYNVGNLDLNDGNYAEAELEYLESIRLEPNFHRSHFNLGLIYYRQGRRDEAITHLEKVTEIKPDYYKAHMGLASMYLDRGDKDRARRELEETLRLRPGNRDALELLKSLESAEGQ